MRFLIACYNLGIKKLSYRKRKTMKKTNLKLLALPLLAAMVFSACSETTPPPAPKQSVHSDFKKGVAGGTMTQTLEVHARVVSVDKTKRTVTLLDSDGEKFDVDAGPEVINFDRIEKGDLVKVTLSRQLVVSVHDNTTKLPEGTSAMVALAPEGEKPGGFAAGTIVRKAQVVAIDKAAHTATLKFSDGQEETLSVRGDVDLGKYNAGDQVLFILTKALAIDVVKAESSK